MGTVLPGVVLIFLALPSLRLLYLLDVEHDAYMLPLDDLVRGDYRLLEVDHRTVVPFSVDVRVLVSAADVLHSWTVPSLGVKADAVPGRLNQLSFFCTRSGVFY